MHGVFGKGVCAIDKRHRAVWGDWVGERRAGCSINWNGQGLPPQAEESLAISKESCLHSSCHHVSPQPLFLSPGKSDPWTLLLTSPTRPSILPKPGSPYSTVEATTPCYCTLSAWHMFVSWPPGQHTFWFSSISPLPSLLFLPVL